MVWCGQRANCRRHPPPRKLHLSYLMIPKVPRLLVHFVLSLALFSWTACAGAQDKPDRPPWAQPSNEKNSGSPPPSGPEVTPQPGVLAPLDPPPDKPQESQTPKGTIKVNVNLVNVLVSVLDEQKRPAPNLPIDAFQVIEEGVPQKIEFFEAETKWPLDIALMIDASLSAHMDIQFERSASAHFIQQVLRPEDRMSIFSFDETVTQRT